MASLGSCARLGKEMQRRWTGVTQQSVGKNDVIRSLALKILSKSRSEVPGDSEPLGHLTGWAVAVPSFPTSPPPSAISVSPV
jgi:hypothetical protein